MMHCVAASISLLPYRGLRQAYQFNVAHQVAQRPDRAIVQLLGLVDQGRVPRVGIARRDAGQTSLQPPFHLVGTVDEEDQRTTQMALQTQADENGDLHPVVGDADGVAGAGDLLDFEAAPRVCR